jgi:hypothetical protein
LFKNILSILVFISLFDLFLFSILEPLVAAIEELRIELELESELDLVSSKVLIVSKSELELTEIFIKVLRIVLVFLLIY